MLAGELESPQDSPAIEPIEAIWLCAIASSPSGVADKFISHSDNQALSEPIAEHPQPICVQNVESRACSQERGQGLDTGYQLRPDSLLGTIRYAHRHRSNRAAWVCSREPTPSAASTLSSELDYLALYMLAPHTRLKYERRVGLPTLATYLNPTAQASSLTSYWGDPGATALPLPSKRTFYPISSDLPHCLSILTHYYRVNFSPLIINSKLYYNATL